MNKAIVSILAGLGGMFGWGTSDFFANSSSDKIGHFKTFFWSQIAGLTLTLFLVLIFGMSFSVPFLFFIFLIVASVFYSVGYLFFYKAFEIGNVSVVAATANLYVIFTMMFAFIFLGQRLTATQLFAVGLILGGASLVSVNFRDLKNKQFKLLAGVKETIIASLIFGVFWNLSEIISEKLGWLPTTLYIKIGAILTLLIFSVLGKRKLDLKKNDNKTKFVLVLIGVLEAAAIASVNWGIMTGEIILVTPVSSAYSIVTILMAVIFLKEKLTKIQVLGILTTITGIILTGF